MIPVGNAEGAGIQQPSSSSSSRFDDWDVIDVLDTFDVSKDETNCNISSTN